ncbi:hypothetical protein ABZ897_53975 [Nonomuraea sp. NPDC046802]|uniref:hypothetical protein n=1 Tax=Nonomuraea sp. NPDC046802 TaxID=3154919 RepID=UPI0033C2EC3E
MDSSLPVTREHSGAVPPHRRPANDCIVADYGLHVVDKTARTYETQWVTLVTLYVNTEPAGRIWLYADLDDPVVEDAILRLDRWRQVLVALGELNVLEHQHRMLVSEAESNEVLLHGMPEAGTRARVDEIFHQVRVLRAVTVERARTLGDRRQLDDIEVIDFDLLYPRRIARYELAAHDLVAWRERKDDRDPVVKEAVAAGLSDSEIQRLSGIARTTINRIQPPFPATSSAPEV